jgi:hypothetical protein
MAMPRSLRHIHPDHVRLERMASGCLSLILREEADWSDFDAFAAELLALVDGQVLSRADSAVERVWTVRVRGQELWLAFDDWHHHFELSARDSDGDDILRALAAELGGGSPL